MRLHSLNNFQQRVLLSILGIALLASLIFLSHVPPFQYLFLACLALVQAGALWEYYMFAEIKGFQPLKSLGTVFSCLYILMHYAQPDSTAVIPFLFIFLALSFIRHFNKAENAIVNLAITLFGLLYITIPLSFLLDITFMSSSIWVVYLLVTTKSTDTFAYCAGKLWGNRKLASLLSPKKTIEGALAGLFGATIISLAFKFGFDMSNSFTVFDAVLVGAGIGIISQIGDLAESLLKRDAQVKDSNSLPGFGGMLDVVDSLLFTTPFLYFYLHAKQLL